MVALINATSILVILAAGLALFAIVRIDNFAGNVIGTMTEAVLSKVDLPSKEVLTNLRELREEVRTLGNALREIKAEENSPLQSEVARLKEALTTLNISVDRLANARTMLTDEAIAQLGRSVTDTLTNTRRGGDAAGGAAKAQPRKKGDPGIYRMAEHEGALQQPQATQLALVWRPRDYSLRTMGVFVRGVLGRHGAEAVTSTCFRPHQQRRQLQAGQS